MRTFDTGATRSPLGDKLEYAGFLSPLVLKRFAEYMHKHRAQADGTIRDSRNWQKGIPLSSYEDSLIRHVIDVWLWCEGLDCEIEDNIEDNIEDVLCAVIFNAQGMLFELLRLQRGERTDGE